MAMALPCSVCSQKALRMSLRGTSSCCLLSVRLICKQTAQHSMNTTKPHKAPEVHMEA